MTSTLTPPNAPGTERAHRLPPILADLLPAEIVQARRARRVSRAVLACLALFTVLLIAVCALTVYKTSLARTDLAREQQLEDQLRAKQHSYATVVAVQAESDRIDSRLAALMANDLQWSTVLSAVRQLAPHGVQLTAITGELADRSAAAAAPIGAQLPNTTGEKSVGTLTVAGAATSKALIASYVDGLGRLAGLGNPVINGVTLTAGAFQFSVQLDITESMLGGRYTSKGGDH
jgi:type IV pilus assembly protein PilN